MEKSAVDHLALLDPNILPQHVGIIMDGNGRWAESRGLNRTAGHKEGLIAAKRVVKAAREIGIPYLSLYTFSTENWQRTKDEVSFLMGLLSTHLRREFDFYREHEIRVIHSGSHQGLPDSVLTEIHDVIEDTKNHRGLTVNLAINYGGRDEITRAVSKVISEVANELSANLEEELLLSSTSNQKELTLRVNQLINEISTNKMLHVNEQGLQEQLDHPELPDLDLIIRSGGEQRLSNFLLWQSSYAELIFDPRFWPDWDEEVFYSTIQTYQSRQRRFGGV